MGKRLLICLTLVLVSSAIIAVLCGVAGGMLNFVFRKMLEARISKYVTLEEGHMTYEQLREPSIPTFKSFYFFNLTNPEEFEAGNATAKLEEIGPFTYGRQSFKTYLQSTNRSELTYMETEHFYFYPGLSGSGLNENAVICTINIPLLVAVYQVLGTGNEDALVSLINMTSANLYTCQSVSGLIWGYTDEFLTTLYQLGLSPTETFWMMTNGTLGSASSLSTIHTGVDDINNLAQFIRWHNQTGYLNTTWPGLAARQIRGTEGIFFRPNLKEGDELAIFVGDLRRAFDLENTAVVDHMGVKAFRYNFPLETFQGAFSQPQNAQWGSWCPDGLFYMGLIRDPELPLYVSKPHFLDGAESLLEGVSGLEPSREYHDSHIDVEPNIGASVDVQIQFQLNIRVNQTDEFNFLENLQGADEYRSLFLPVFYINQQAEFSEEIKGFLEDGGLGTVKRVRSIVTLVFYVLVGVAGVSGLVMLVSATALVIAVVKLKQSKSEELKPLMDPELPTAIVHQYYAKKRAEVHSRNQN